MLYQLRTPFGAGLLLSCLSCLVSGYTLAADSESADNAAAELRVLMDKVPSFRVTTLPAQPREVVLKRDDTLTVKLLRGIELDDSPPKLGIPETPYGAQMTDTFPMGAAPYVAAGIKPFRFRYFNCEFNYGGWHNFAMADYAATRGFNIIYPYTREIRQAAHLPKGTKWLSWGGFINWHKWFGEHGLPEERYDLLSDRNLAQLHLDEGKFDRPADPVKLSQRGDYLMIDMEHPVLSPEKLRSQSWYPSGASDSKKTAFEQHYYDGYAQTYISAIKAAREQGWRNISLYGWAPYGRTWGGLEKPEVDPGSDHAWNMFGKQIYENVDIINNSVYCFYWSPQNVAYTLANIDANMALVDSMPEKKPVRPYYWTLLHGGGGGWRWWRGQPLAKEEKRAMIAMAFFTGIDGFDTWNWSGTGNHHVPPPLASDTNDKDYFTSGADLMLKDTLELLPEGSPSNAEPESLARYDAVHVIGVDDAANNVRFQKIRLKAKDKGISDDQPVFTMSINEFRQHVRVKSEPVAAMIEGMALVRPFEYILSHGEVHIDVPARQQFKQTLPIVRRVKHGRTHLIITYDPYVIYGGTPRDILLNDFDGHRGLTLRLPADEEVRIFAVRSLPIPDRAVSVSE